MKNHSKKIHKVGTALFFVVFFVCYWNDFLTNRGAKKPTPVFVFTAKSMEQFSDELSCNLESRGFFIDKDNIAEFHQFGFSYFSNKEKGKHFFYMQRHFSNSCTFIVYAQEKKPTKKVIKSTSAIFLSRSRNNKKNIDRNNNHKHVDFATISNNTLEKPKPFLSLEVSDIKLFFIEAVDICKRYSFKITTANTPEGIIRGRRSLSKNEYEEILIWIERDYHDPQKIIHIYLKRGLFLRKAIGKICPCMVDSVEKNNFIPLRDEFINLSLRTRMKKESSMKK